MEKISPAASAQFSASHKDVIHSSEGEMVRHIAALIGRVVLAQFAKAGVGMPTQRND